MDGSSSLKAFLALTGERENKRFLRRKDLISQVKLTLYKTFGKFSIKL